MTRSQEDFEDEIRSHLELEAARLRAQGMTPQDAELGARKNFGNVGIAQERFHASQRLSWMHDFAQDVRYAARTLRRTPGFAIAVILTLALGIGANSGVFTIVNTVLFRPLPYPDSDRILSLSMHDDGADRSVLDDRNFLALAAGEAPSLQYVAASRGGDKVVETDNGARLILGSAVTSQYFGVYGFSPMRGRVFTADEDRPSGPDVVVISEQMWRTVFASDSGIVGKTISIDRKAHSVLGVMPAGLTTAKRAQYWTPLRVAPPQPGRQWFYSVVARMRPDATLDAVRAEIGTVRRRLFDQQTLKTRNQQSPVALAMTLHERRFGSSRRTLMLLWGAVGVLLLMACANIANLSLARATRREREFATRLALGAGRVRLVRQVLCECLLLSVGGASLGALMAAASVGFFVRISPGTLANVEGVRLDATALVFTFAIAVTTTVLFGLAPALRAARGHVGAVLANGTPKAAGSRREQLARRTLIVAQLATAVVMLTGTAIVTKTLARVASIDTGIDVDNLLVVEPALERVRYTPQTAEAFYQELVARLERDPSVRDVALTDAAPLGGVSSTLTMEDSTGKRTIDLVEVGVNFFPTIGARLVEGRWFSESDRPGAEKVAIVNEALARAQFPGRSAIGQSIEADGRWTIIGIVADFRQRGLEHEPSPVMYKPLLQTGPALFQEVLVRTSPGAPSIGDRVRAMIREIDVAQLPPEIVTMRDRMDDAIAPRRFTVVLLGLFAGLAATLAIVGLYGLLSYLVAERTREIGIRVALGADAGRVLRFVLGSGMVLTATGVVLGVGAAVFTVRLLESLVYDMSVYDPWMFGVSAILLIVVALVASYLPARRAAAIDPVTALRSE